MSTKDFLIERLATNSPENRDRCVSEWAHPLDAAILLALLIKFPQKELAQWEAGAEEGRKD